MPPGCSPDQGVGQLDAVGSPQRNGDLGGLPVDLQQRQGSQALPNQICLITLNTYHHFDPRDDADGMVAVTPEFFKRRGPTAKDVNDDVGVEKRAHHSDRSRS